MRVDDAGRGEKSRIRNAPYAGVSVVVGHVLEQPVDAVVEIAGVVHILLGSLIVDVRPHLDECTFRHITPAHILEDENVSRLVEVRRRAELLTELIHSIRTHAVRGSIDQKRVGAGTILGHVYRGEEAHAIAHGDSVLVLGVVFLGIVLRRLGLALGGEIGG